MRSIGRPLPALFLLVLFLPTASLAAESPAKQLERQVKAAFIYKFSGYVEWPAASFPRPESPILIGVAGDGRLAADLQQMVTGRTSGGRSLAVLPLDRDDHPKSLHVLFVTGTEAERIHEWADAVRGTPTLVVTDAAGALDKGSMINFVPSDGRIRFEVALTPAAAAGLKLSSGLLAVAKTVVPAAATP